MSSFQWFPSIITGIEIDVPTSIMGVINLIPDDNVISIYLVDQDANTIWAGPVSGGPGVPTFRNLVAADFAFAAGDLTDTGTDGITITGGTGAVFGTGTSIAQHVADATHNGYLSSADWTTFSSHGGGSVSSVSVVSANGFAGTVATATTTPAITLSTTITGLLEGNGTTISAATTGDLTDAGTDGITVTSGTGAVLGSGTSIAQHVADTTHNGYLSSTDWNTFSGKGSGSVTSVTFTGDGTVLSSTPSSAVTTTGTLTAALKTQTANTVLSGPTTGVAANPTFRALVAADLPFSTGNLTSTPTTNLVVTGGTGAVIGSGALLTLTGASIVEATSAVLTLTGATNAVLGTGVSIQVKQSSTSQSGYLSSTDWNTFNGKQATLTIGNLTDAGTDGIVVTGGTGSVIGSGTSLAQHVADTTHNGYLSSTDWTTFNGKQSSLTIGNLTDAGTDGIVVTGGTGSIIGSGTSLAQHVADSTHNGYLSSTDWSTFNNKQATITSGNLTEATSAVLTISGGTGSVLGTGTSLQVKQATTSQAGYLSSTDWNTFNGKGSGNGTVTSVTFTGDGTVLSSTPSSAVTTTGTVTASLISQVKNTFLAGPTTGANAAPTYRVMATADFIAPTTQILTGSGTYTTPTSPRGPLYLMVTAVGPGGGGAATITNAGSNGSAATTFGTASAGAGSGGVVGGAGGAGGAVTAGFTSAKAVVGSAGNPASSTTTAGGSGGASILSGAGAGGAVGAAGSSAATGSGSGGGGAIGSGGGGAGGFVEATVTSPAVSYSYVVGTGGNGGTAGTHAGGNGAAGYIRVVEHYQ